jgi:hypothetical protein
VTKPPDRRTLMICAPRYAETSGFLPGRFSARAAHRQAGNSRCKCRACFLRPVSCSTGEYSRLRLQYQGDSTPIDGVRRGLFHVLAKISFADVSLPAGLELHAVQKTTLASVVPLDSIVGDILLGG